MQEEGGDPNTNLKIKTFCFLLPEASYFDQINMTENRLEYDLKNITPTNMNVGT